MSVIKTRQLSKSYGTRRGIQQVDLSVDSGEIFGFLGPNGAGKSTLIRILLGFLRASAGSAEILGHDCWNDGSAVRRNLGYVPGDVRLYPWLTARRALRITERIRKIDLMPSGLELAARFRLEPDLPVRKMSRGNRQKVSLVLSLAHQPQVIVLDEPTSGLDPLMQDILADCLREAAAEGRTVFFSSHTLSEVEELCDQVAIVREGAIVVNERLEVLRRNAPRAVTLTFASEEAAAAAAWPEFIRVQRHDKAVVRLHMEGEAARLITWAAGQAIRDMEIGPPSLDAVFRSHYATPGAND